MRHEDYVRDRERSDPELLAERASLRSQYEFRRALIGARLAAGLTQAQVASRMNTTQSAVARLESGETLPRVETLCKLAAVLGVDFEITRDGGITVRT